MHKSVLLNEVLLCLNIKPNGIYVDGTFGEGGHSYHILSRLSKDGKLFAMDRDPTSIKLSSVINDKRFNITNKLFSKMEEYIDSYNLLGKVHGILLDLGLSSIQLDDAERGFSFMKDGPLDMRMDQTFGYTAAQWLYSASEKEIYNVLLSFGEERFSKLIASIIISNRNYYPIVRTHQLVELLLKNISFGSHKKHPATRVFQAIRIYINNELEELKNVLNSISRILITNGVLVIITFHSLEDRIVKYFMKNNSIQKKHVSIYSSINNVSYQDKHLFNKNFLSKKLDNYDISPYIFIKTGKIKPTFEEIKYNIRSRSAILRFAIKK